MSVPVGGNFAPELDQGTAKTVVLSGDCQGKRHRLCDGYSRAVRNHPKIEAADQVLPCLCPCHGTFRALEQGQRT